MLGHLNFKYLCVPYGSHIISIVLINIINLLVFLSCVCVFFMSEKLIFNV